MVEFRGRAHHLRSRRIALLLLTKRVKELRVTLELGPDSLARPLNMVWMARTRYRWRPTRAGYQLKLRWHLVVPKQAFFYFRP